MESGGLNRCRLRVFLPVSSHAVVEKFAVD